MTPFSVIIPRFGPSTSSKNARTFVEAPTPDREGRQQALERDAQAVAKRF